MHKKTYNVKLFDYKYGSQIRVYNKPISRMEKDRNDLDEKSYKLDSDGQISFKDPEKKKTKDRKIKIEVSSDRASPSESSTLSEERQRSIENSKNRTKQKIYECCRANTWEWFCTFTFNPDLINRYDYKTVSSAMSKWLNSIKKDYCPDLKYILIPEAHKDGAIHFHGLFSNTGSLTFVDSGVSFINKDGDRIQIKNLVQFYLGFSNITEVYHPERITSYITKYITKDLVLLTENNKRYWISRNLEKPDIIEYNLRPEEMDDMYVEISDSILHIKQQIIGEGDQINKRVFNKITYIEIKGDQHEHNTYV